MFAKIKPIWLGIIAGILASLVFGLVYFVVLREPGSAFYLFAGLIFLGAPLTGGVIAVMKTLEHRRKTFLAASSAVLGVVFTLFIILYLVVPISERASVEMPAYCEGVDGSVNPSSQLMYALPDQSTGILIIADRETAVVARVDANQPPFPTQVYIVRKTGNKILQSMTFPNDVVSAALGDGHVYIYNDKIGLFFDAHTGSLADNLFTIDNYGGLSQTDRPVMLSGESTGHWYLETSAVISSWNANGTVIPRSHLTFNGIALGCFVSGSTQEVIRY